MKGRKTRSRLTGVQRALAAANRREYEPDLHGIAPPHVAHVWPFDEYRFSRSFATKIRGVVGRFDIPRYPYGDGGYGSVAPLMDDHHSSLANGPRYLKEGGEEQFECFNGTDWMILVASKGHGDGSSFEFTIGRPEDGVTATGMFLKIQPYYFAINLHVSHQITAPWGYLHTPQRTASTVNRVVGQEYMIAYVKRGDKIEHWVDGVLQGENTISLLLEAEGRTYEDICVPAAELIHVMRPAARVRVGHSGTGLMNQALKSGKSESDYPHMIDGDTAAYTEEPAGFGQDGKPVVNETTQYAGISINSWPAGQMVTDVAAFMNWHKTQWFAGNKRIDYPGE